MLKMGLELHIFHDYNSKLLRVIKINKESLKQIILFYWTWTVNLSSILYPGDY